jgi:myo-inositol-1(or 4)-monophosphatase
MTDNAAAHNAIHDTAIAAVDAAVAVLAESLGDTTTLSAHGRDIKTQADLDAESAMFEILRSTSSLPILSEEAGADSGFDATATGWVVDPLDGTANFARGLPIACTCLALLRDGTPALGIVHDVFRNERWMGGPDLPTTCNGTPVQCSTMDDMSQAILTTGFPRLFDFTHDSIDTCMRRLSAFKKVRMIGSAGMSLAWTAGGRMDVYSEEGIFLWDVAAGLALVEGAGGRVHSSAVAKDWRCDVIAGAPALVDQLVKQC